MGTHVQPNTRTHISTHQLQQPTTSPARTHAAAAPRMHPHAAAATHARARPTRPYQTCAATLLRRRREDLNPLEVPCHLRPPPLTSSPPSVPGATHIIRNVVHRGRERNLAVPYLSACRIFSACFAGEQHRKQQQAHAHAQPQATAHAHTTTTKTRAHTHLCHGVPVRSPLKPVQRAVAVRINVRKQGIARARTETRCGDLRRQRCCCARRRQRRRTRADAPA